MTFKAGDVVLVHRQQLAVVTDISGSSFYSIYSAENGFDKQSTDNMELFASVNDFSIDAVCGDFVIAVKYMDSARRVYLLDEDYSKTKLYETMIACVWDEIMKGR